MDLNEKLNYTALLKAAADNSKEVVALLLDNPGVDVNAASCKGFTALHFAADEGHLEVVVLLLKHPGVHVNAAVNNGYKALHFASIQGHLEQRPKKSELSGWQLSTRKNFPDKAWKSFSRQKKCA